MDSVKEKALAMATGMVEEIFRRAHGDVSNIFIHMVFQGQSGWWNVAQETGVMDARFILAGLLELSKAVMAASPDRLKLTQEALHIMAAAADDKEPEEAARWN